MMMGLAGSYKTVKLEYRVGLIFGVVALFLSLLIGIAAGNPLTIGIVRAIIFAVVFSLIGAGSVVLIKKYVPDLFSLFTNEGETLRRTEQPENVVIGDSPDSINQDAPEGNYSGARAEDEGISKSGVDSEPSAGSESQFEPLGDYYKRSADIESSSSVSEKNVPTMKKMGKHLLKEKGIKYEPKIMAEAIRTLMSKDQ